MLLRPSGAPTPAGDPLEDNVNLLMANLTITLDDDLLKRARIRAAELGTSVNAVLRDYMEAGAGVADRRRAVDALLVRSKRAKSARGAQRWTRNDLHDR